MRKELPGATIVCRSCNHNNAMQRVKQWREEGGKVITDSTPSKHPGGCG
ncbi:MAG: hypothetical protein IPJ07_25830 [Acidobacteria bacterium]|nr:hypothetical protein [Acidobacteriota bacterium]